MGIYGVLNQEDIFKEHEVGMGCRESSVIMGWVVGSPMLKMKTKGDIRPYRTQFGQGFILKVIPRHIRVNFTALFRTEPH